MEPRLYYRPLTESDIWLLSDLQSH